MRAADPLLTAPKKGGVAREVCHRNHRYLVSILALARSDVRAPFQKNFFQNQKSSRGSISIFPRIKNRTVEGAMPKRKDWTAQRFGRAPAVRDWKMCRMHGARGGAPKGKRNGNYRHGDRMKEMIELWQLIKSLR
jgi:hypothetical protein